MLIRIYGSTCILMKIYVEIDGRPKSEEDIQHNHIFMFIIPDLSFLYLLASASCLPTSDINFDLSLNLSAAGGFIVESNIFSVFQKA
jgi:hypothetical protein